jgi:acetolactate synthase-1/2/3 large subunit
MAGKAAKAAIEECDLIISAGARLGNRVIDIGGLVERGKKLVQIDADRAEINKIAKADGYIAADAKAALKAILAHFKGIPERDPWFSPKKTPDDVDAAFPAPPKMKKGQIRPENIFKTVKETLGDGITVVTDVGLHQLYTAKYYPLSPADNFITSGGLGTMGFGLGASIGASTARPGRTTVLFTGDGGFMMDMNELATVSYEKLPLIVIVMRNGELGMVREMQRIHCARRYSQTKLDQKLNIPKLCSAFGLKGVRAGSTEELKRALNDALSEKRAVIIEVRTVLRSVENA